MKIRALSVVKSAAGVLGVVLILYGFGRASDSYRLMEGRCGVLGKGQELADSLALVDFPNSIDPYLYCMVAGFFMVLLSARDIPKFLRKQAP